MEAPTHSPTTQDLRDQMIEDACNVMISQQLLRKHANDVRARLRQKVLVAEERGFDYPEPCESNVEEACDYLDAVELYRRMLEDARALRVPRYVISNGLLPLDQ